MMSFLRGLPPKVALLVASLAALLTVAAGGSHAKPLQVSVTILPLYAITASLMEGVGTPSLIYPPAISPHAVQQNPSMVRAIQDSDLVIWVGPQLETGLTSLMEAIHPPDKRLTLINAPGIPKLMRRDVGFVKDRKTPEPGADSAVSDSLTWDPHIWLDPVNGATIARLIASRLKALDPSQETKFAHNLQRFLTRLATTEMEMTRLLGPVREKGFVIMHDAFHYLEKRFGLTNLAVITVSDLVPPSAGHVFKLGKLAKTTPIHCLLFQVDSFPRSGKAIARALAITTAPLDPIGYKLNRNDELYFNLLLTNARTIAECLQ